MSIRRMNKVLYVLLSVILLLTAFTSFTGCSSDEEPGATSETIKQGSEEAKNYPLHDPLVRFKIATTTSLYDTGLWYHLEPIFEELANVEMDIVYAGTGIALEYGRRGDVDAIIVHDHECTRNTRKTTIRGIHFAVERAHGPGRRGDCHRS